MLLFLLQCWSGVICGARHHLCHWDNVDILYPHSEGEIVFTITTQVRYLDHFQLVTHDTGTHCKQQLWAREYREPNYSATTTAAEWHFTYSERKLGGTLNNKSWNCGGLLCTAVKALIYLGLLIIHETDRQGPVIIRRRG